MGRLPVLGIRTCFPLTGEDGKDKGDGLRKEGEGGGIAGYFSSFDKTGKLCCAASCVATSACTSLKLAPLVSRTLRSRVCSNTSIEVGSSEARSCALISSLLPTISTVNEEEDWSVCGMVLSFVTEPKPDSSSSERLSAGVGWVDAITSLAFRGLRGLYFVGCHTEIFKRKKKFMSMKW